MKTTNEILELYNDLDPECATVKRHFENKEWIEKENIDNFKRELEIELFDENAPSESQRELNKIFSVLKKYI